MCSKASRAPLSFRIKSQDLTMVSKPAHLAVLTSCLYPLCSVHLLRPPGLFWSTANEFKPRTSAFAVSLAWTTSLLPTQCQLLQTSDLFGFSPHNYCHLAYRFILTWLLSCLSVSFSLQKNVGSKKGGMQLCSVLYCCV